MNVRDALEKGNHLGRLIKESEMWKSSLVGEPKTENTLAKLEMANDQQEKFIKELNHLRNIFGPSTKQIENSISEVHEIFEYVTEQRQTEIKKHHDD